MVLKPEPIFACYRDIEEDGGGPVDEFIFLTPDGETLIQKTANRLSIRPVLRPCSMARRSSAASFMASVKSL